MAAGPLLLVEVPTLKTAFSAATPWTPGQEITRLLKNSLAPSLISFSKDSPEPMNKQSPVGISKLPPGKAVVVVGGLGPRTRHRASIRAGLTV